MKQLTGPLCAFLALVCAQGVRAEVDSRTVYRSLVTLKAVAENEGIDRGAMSYDEQAVVKSIRQPSNRMKVIAVMLDLSDAISQEQAESVSGGTVPFETLFGRSASLLAGVVVDPGLSETIRIGAVNLLEQMALRFRFVESVPSVPSEARNAAVEDAVRRAQALIPKQRKLLYFNYNGGGSGPARLKE